LTISIGWIHVVATIPEEPPIMNGSAAFITGDSTYLIPFKVEAASPFAPTLIDMLIDVLSLQQP
jgi:hypothetical protein